MAKAKVKRECSITALAKILLSLNARETLFLLEQIQGYDIEDSRETLGGLLTWAEEFLANAS